MKMKKYLTPFTVTDGIINNNMDMLLDSTIHYSFKNDFINTYKAKDSKELFNKVFAIENIKIRQFLSEKFQIIRPYCSKYFLLSILALPFYGNLHK